jgi:CcmD family protein
MDSNFGYLVAAYGIVWIGIALYVARLGAQIGGLRRDVSALRETLAETEHR